jgi:hypothetical protein
MTFRKVAAIPAKADLEMQSDFKNVLESEIARAKACDKVQGAKFKMRNKITLRFDLCAFAVLRAANVGTCLVRTMRSRVS